MIVLVLALLASYIHPIGMYLYLRKINNNDSFKKDCFDLLWNGLLLGFPVFGFSLLCNIIFRITHISDKYPIIEILFSAFILKAFSEELMKYILSRKIINKNKKTISFIELMAFTCISAIGFEIMEAFVYFFSTNIPQILVRGITNMHAFFGLLMGYIIARGYKNGKKNPEILGILIPTIIHGVYDLCLHETLVDKWGGISLAIAAASLIFNIYIFFFIRKAKKDPYYTDPLF